MTDEERLGKIEAIITEMKTVFTARNRRFRGVFNESEGDKVNGQ